MLDIGIGAIKALCCFAVILGAALIFNYGDEKARALKHKIYQSIIIIFTALLCLVPAYKSFEGVPQLTVPGKIAFVVVAILCAISFVAIILHSNEK